MNTANTDWFFIVNPHAGSGKTMSDWVPAERMIYDKGIPYVVAYTDFKRHAISLAYGAASKGYRRILSVGGDGTLHETFNGVMEWCAETSSDPSEFTIAVAPIGSGNDWIKSLGVPHDTKKVAELLANESFGQMDVVRIECSDTDGSNRTSCYMANCGGTGIDSHVCDKVNRQKERGFRSRLIYLNALLSSVFHLHTVSLRVVADGKEMFSGECYSIALGNGCYSGSGLRQVPDAKIDDGLLDVTVIPKLPVLSILKEIPRLFNGTLERNDRVLLFKCSELQIIPLDESSRDIIELDGEVVGRLPARISISGEKINVLKGCQ